MVKVKGTQSFTVEEIVNCIQGHGEEQQAKGLENAHWDLAIVNFSGANQWSKGAKAR